MVEAAQLPENISREFYDFLAGVDVGVRRPSEHVLKIAAVFVANDIGSPNWCKLCRVQYK